MPPRCIEPARGRLRGTFRAPSSKSATHRALLAAALASGRSTVRLPLDAEDTRVTLDGLAALGIPVSDEGDCWHVTGTGGPVPGGGNVALGASGSSARFLTALAALGRAPSRLDGTPRLRERPMHELIDALAAAGAHVAPSAGGRFPLAAGGTAVRGGRLVVAGNRSSQFASALLLIGCACREGIELVVPEPRVSWSYVRMTIEMLEAFGARVVVADDGGLAVPPQRLTATTVTIEADHSSASYAFAATVVVGGRTTAAGLRSASAQPDARFLRDLAGLGARVVESEGGIVVDADGAIPAFAWDLSDAPDLAPGAAVLALFAEGPSSLSGLHHLRLKESDRVEAIRRNLERMGAAVSVSDGTIGITPPGPAIHGATIETMGDHRIAMAFAVAGLRVPGVTIDDDLVVAKSYPQFWRDFEEWSKVDR
ncbi:MAG TPA: 3-phosphoshikimate 1-carboxyvinyltransferase [Candidatus Polarisedimenticolaceae bacterium]|nr:3-phosphoshikimate 1-carboxyvinyltransferase [Candidatus Polarisedimenticolaceae bacterium]